MLGPPLSFFTFNTMSSFVNVQHKVCLDFIGWGSRGNFAMAWYFCGTETVLWAPGSGPVTLLSLQPGQTWLQGDWAKLIHELSNANHNSDDNSPSLYHFLSWSVENLSVSSQLSITIAFSSWLDTVLHIFWGILQVVKHAFPVFCLQTLCLLGYWKDS